MSELTDKLYMYTLLKCKKDGMTRPDQVKLLFEVTKQAYYTGTDEFREVIAEELKELVDGDE